MGRRRQADEHLLGLGLFVNSNKRQKRVPRVTRQRKGVLHSDEFNARRRSNVLDAQTNTTTTVEIVTTTIN